MIRINQLQLPVQHTEEELLHKAAKLLHLPITGIREIKIIKQSIDARKKYNLLYSYTVDVALQEGKESELVRKVKSTQIKIQKEQKFQFPEYGASVLPHPPVIIGSGPAGLFCAFFLAKHGYCPILLERGEDVDRRIRKVSHFWEGGSLDTQTNVQFGEGGAGTFSDGKLNTLVKDPALRNQMVLELFVEFGADPSILYQNKPHIGTDVLSRIVKGMREAVIQMGGQVHFCTQVTDFIMEQNRLTGLILKNSKKMNTEAVVLAVGHSARDTFETLYQRGVPMEQKAFAVGFRIEHPQKMIDRSQYGEEGAKLLGAASYKLTAQTSSGRGVYSFCMCPGGYVVNASSEVGHLAVNGMSYHDRDGKNANSAVIVTVTPEDFSDTSPLGGIAYQRQLETMAYQYGNGSIPLQLYGDFKQNKESAAFGEISPQLKGAYRFANLRSMVPSYLGDSLIEGIEDFGKKIQGFSRLDAVLSGVESRTSSPIRILRNTQFESPVAGLYPCGEGAGYAGGITSAAMDGIRVAEELAKRYAPLDQGGL